MVKEGFLIKKSLNKLKEEKEPAGQSGTGQTPPATLRDFTKTQYVAQNVAFIKKNIMQKVSDTVDKYCRTS